MSAFDNDGVLGGPRATDRIDKPTSRTVALGSDKTIFRHLSIRRLGVFCNVLISLEYDWIDEQGASRSAKFPGAELQKYKNNEPRSLLFVIYENLWHWRKNYDLRYETSRAYDKRDRLDGYCLMNEGMLKAVEEGGPEARSCIEPYIDGENSAIVRWESY